MKNKITPLIIVFSIYAGCVYAGPDGPAKSEKLLNLSLDEVKALALKENIDIKIARLEALIESQNLGEELSLFDLFLNGKIEYSLDKKKPVSSLFGPREEVKKYSFGADKKTTTGTTYSFTSYLQRSWVQSAFYDMNPYYEGYAALTVTQALGKNFFGLQDRGSLKITKLQIKNSHLLSWSRIEADLVNVSKAYWQLVFKQEEIKIRRDLLKEAKKLYDIYSEKLENGLAELPEVLATKANVLAKENELAVAEQERQTLNNDIEFLLNLESVRVIPTDSLYEEAIDVDFSEWVKTAMRHRRDYRQAKNDIEIGKIDLSMKKNALWPEIDLEATFAKNNIDSRYKDVFAQLGRESRTEVSAGISVSFSLQNTKERAQCEKSLLRKAKAILAVKNIEKLILTQLMNSRVEISTLNDRLEKDKEIVLLQQKKLRAEEVRIKLGRSDSDTLIRYQNDVFNARLAQARRSLFYLFAEIDLKVRMGIFLKGQAQDEIFVADWSDR